MSYSVIQNRTPLGLTIPIRNAGVGFFEQTFDTFTQVKTNIINLLKTKPGERRMQPLLGCRLYTVVFNQNTPLLSEYITNIIKEDITNWIPNVTVNTVNVKFLTNQQQYNNIDNYIIYVAVNFTVNIINQTDGIEIVINGGNS